MKRVESLRVQLKKQKEKRKFNLQTTKARAGKARFYGYFLLSSFFSLLFISINSARIPNIGPGIPEVTVDDPKLLWTQTLQVNNPRDEANRKSGMNVSHLYKGYVFLILGGDGHHTGPRAIDLFSIGSQKNTITFDLAKRYYTDETQMLGESHSFGFFTLDEKDFGVFHTEEGIAIWDLTDVNDFKLASRVNIGGIFQTNYDGTAFGVFAQWPYAYVAGSNTGLRVVNIRDPYNPYVAKTMDINEVGQNGGRLGFAYAIGNLLFLSGVEKPGWSLLDISRPADPVLMYSNTDGLTYHANLYGDRIHVLGRLDETLHTYKMKKMEDYEFGDAEFVIKESASPGIQKKSEYLYFNDGRMFIGGGEVSIVGKYNTSTLEFENQSGYMFLTAGKANEGHPIPFGNFTFVGDDHGTGSGIYVTDLIPDKISPHAALTVPANGSTGRSIASRVGVQFSSMVTVESVNKESFVVKKKSTGEQVEGVYSAWQNYINFAPYDLFETSTEYEVAVTEGITDWAGNPAIPVTFSFTTSGFDESTLPIDPDRESVDPLFTLPTTKRHPMRDNNLISNPVFNPIWNSDSLLTSGMYKRVWASSEDDIKPVLNVIDGSNGSYWQSTWRDDPPPPHSLFLQLRESTTLTAMIVQPTSSYLIGEYELYIGESEATASLVHTGDFTYSREKQFVSFNPVEGSFIELRILEGTPNPNRQGYVNELAAITEIGFLGGQTRPTPVIGNKARHFNSSQGKFQFYNLQGKRVPDNQLVPNNIYFHRTTDSNSSRKFLFQGPNPTREWVD